MFHKPLVSLVLAFAAASSATTSATPVDQRRNYMVVVSRPRNMCKGLIHQYSDNIPLCCQYITQSLRPSWLQQLALTNVRGVTRWPYQRRLHPCRSRSVNVDATKTFREELSWMGGDRCR